MTDGESDGGANGDYVNKQQKNEVVEGERLVRLKFPTAAVEFDGRFERRAPQPE